MRYGIIVMMVATLAFTSGLLAQAPSFEDLTKPYYEDLANYSEGDTCPWICIKGTLTAGRDDPTGKMEYGLHIIASETGKDWRLFESFKEIGSVNISWLDDKKMKRGETRSFVVKYPLFYHYQNHYKFLSIGLLERDYMGMSVDVIIAAMFGGLSDCIGKTPWTAFSTFEKKAQSIEFGPTRKGTHLTMTVEIVHLPKTATSETESE